MRAAVADVRESGRDPARQQRRHTGVPMVREGARPPAGLESAGRCRRDRATHLRWPGSARRRRDEHGQPVLRRCHENALHHEPDGAGPRHRRGRLLALLRGSRRVRPDHRPDPGRAHQGVPGSPPSERDGHPAQDPSRRSLPRPSSGQQRRPPRPECDVPHERDQSGHADHVRGLRRLRRARAPRRAGTTRIAPLAFGRGPGARFDRTRHGERPP